MPLHELAKKFLDYSFSDIDYRYEDLSDVEKSLCTQEEFVALVAWIRDVSTTT